MNKFIITNSIKENICIYANNIKEIQDAINIYKRDLRNYLCAIQLKINWKNTKNVIYNPNISEYDKPMFLNKYDWSFDINKIKCQTLDQWFDSNVKPNEQFIDIKYDGGFNPENVIVPNIDQTTEILTKKLNYIRDSIIKDISKGKKLEDFIQDELNEFNESVDEFGSYIYE